MVVDTDEGFRPDTTLASPGRLRPAFTRHGTITAASSSQISAGAAELVVVSRGYAGNGLNVFAATEGTGSSGEPDHYLHFKPADAPEAGCRSGVSISSRSTRPSVPWWCSPCATWTSTRKSAIPTEVRSLRGIRQAPPEPASW